MGRKRLLACFLAVMATCISVAQEQGKAQTQKKEAGARKAAGARAGAPEKDLMRKVWDAWQTLDPSKAAAFYAKDPGLVFYDLAPLKYTGWSEYQQGTKEFFGGVQSMRANLNKDAKVEASEHGALGTATVQLEITQKSGQTEKMEARWTVVWERRGNDWLIVHEHLSAVAPLSPAQSKPALRRPGKEKPAQGD